MAREVTRGSDRRGAVRYPFDVPVRVHCGSFHGKGSLRDMSTTGACIEDADFEPAEGDALELEFLFFQGMGALKLSGVVGRRTETGGFSVLFAREDLRACWILYSLLPRAAGTTELLPPR
jgi:hypothetical protein